MQDSVIAALIYILKMNYKYHYYSEGNSLDQIVNFKYHFDHLCSQLDLVLFGDQSLENANLCHVVNLCSNAGDSYLVTVLLDLSCLGLLKSIVCVHSRVIGKDQRDLLQGRSKGPNGILFD